MIHKLSLFANSVESLHLDFSWHASTAHTTFSFASLHAGSWRRRESLKDIRLKIEENFHFGSSSRWEERSVEENGKIERGYPLAMIGVCTSGLILSFFYSPHFPWTFLLLLIRKSTVRVRVSVVVCGDLVVIQHCLDFVKCLFSLSLLIIWKINSAGSSSLRLLRLSLSRGKRDHHLLLLLHLENHHVLSHPRTMCKTPCEILSSLFQIWCFSSSLPSLLASFETEERIYPLREKWDGRWKQEVYLSILFWLLAICRRQSLHDFSPLTLVMKSLPKGKDEECVWSEELKRRQSFTRLITWGWWYFLPLVLSQFLSLLFLCIYFTC